MGGIGEKRGGSDEEGAVVLENASWWVLGGVTSCGGSKTGARRCKIEL